MNEETFTVSEIPVLDEAQKDRLRLWASATPSQRLAWLEEALRLLAAAKTAEEISRKP